MTALCGHWAVPLVAEGSNGSLLTFVPEAGMSFGKLRSRDVKLLNVKSNDLFDNSFLKVFCKVSPNLCCGTFGSHLGYIMFDHDFDKLLEAGLGRIPS